MIYFSPHTVDSVANDAGATLNDRYDTVKLREPYVEPVVVPVHRKRGDQV